MTPEMKTTVPWSLVKGGFKKTPRFNTLLQETATGRGNTAVSLMPFAGWDFEVDLNYVEGGEGVKFSVFQQFLGCFLAARGRGSLFYFTDPNDNGVSANGILLNVTPGAAAPFSTTGDGVSSQFQAARQIDQGIDIIQGIVNPDFAPKAHVNGVLANGVVYESGLFVFTTPPPSGAVLNWQGQFRYLCRFTEDTVQGLARISANVDRNGFKRWLWSASSISFKSEFV